jgi:arylsulfatase A-like enzyme
MKTNNHYLWKGMALISSLIVLNPSCNNSEEKEANKPNIILILVDDLGYGDLSCYGQETLTTPHIDKMATEGILFTDHYAGSTVCAPSRSALMTGFHTGNVGVRDNRTGQLLQDNEPTLATVLKSAGYVTGAIGKWGIGHPPPPDDPQRKGFDYFYGYINMYHAHNFYPEFLYRNGEKVFLEGNRLYRENEKNPWANQEGMGVSEEREQHTHHLLEKEALEFIEANKDTSFFLYLPFNVPHANNEAGRYRDYHGMEVDDYGPFADKLWPDVEKGFARQIQYMDESVGRINNKLKELGIDDNTLVIFTSDNGPHNEGGHSYEFFNSNGELRGFKRDLYEGGIRIPFIAKWPDKIIPGSQSDHVSAFWDYMPTFCEIAGEPVPVNTDGISFLPALTGRDQNQEEHEYLYWEFGKQAIRKNNWKLVRLNTRTSNPAKELYDLSTDIAEKHDISHKYPEIVDQLVALMENAHTPLIAHWPDGISQEKRLVTDAIHIIDIMPTCLEIAGINYPEQFKGNSILPLDGKSFYSIFDNKKYNNDRTLFWEHSGNKAIRINEKKLVKLRDSTWELYDMKNDPTELNNLIIREPELADSLENIWNEWAKEYGVLEWPLQNPGEFK